VSTFPLDRVTTSWSTCQVRKKQPVVGRVRVVEDKRLVQIEERVNIGVVTEDDILHLLERAKQGQRFQTLYEGSLDEVKELRIKLALLGERVTEMESHVFYSN
jgi:hypothetical protein